MKKKLSKHTPKSRLTLAKLLKVRKLMDQSQFKGPFRLFIPHTKLAQFNANMDAIADLHEGKLRARKMLEKQIRASLTPHQKALLKSLKSVTLYAKPSK